MPIAIKTIELFSAASRLCLNLKKCELLFLEESDSSQVCNIPIKDKITYLGIHIMKNEERCCVNFNLISDKTKKKLNQWLQRDLSLKGRVLLTKAEGFSCLTYAAIPLFVNKKLCNSIDKLLFHFFGKNKTHYVKKSVIMNTFDTVV
jgi:hypothetical protein